MNTGSDDILTLNMALAVHVDLIKGIDLDEEVGNTGTKFLLQKDWFLVLDEHTNA